MVTTADFSDRRRRWLRRASVAATATAVLGIGTAGLSVAVVSARHTTPAISSTTATDSGLGSAPADSAPQGGSHGS